MDTEKAKAIETIGRATTELRQLADLVVKHGSDAQIVQDWIDANQEARLRRAGISESDHETHGYEMADRLTQIRGFCEEEEITLSPKRRLDGAQALVRNDTWPAVRARLAQWALEERETGDPERDGDDPGEPPPP